MIEQSFDGKLFLEVLGMLKTHYPIAYAISLLGLTSVAQI